MQEIKTFKQSELVLKVNCAYDTTLLDLAAWEPYIDRLCSNRVYQKEATFIKSFCLQWRKFCVGSSCIFGLTMVNYPCKGDIADAGFICVGCCFWWKGFSCC